MPRPALVLAVALVASPAVTRADDPDPVKTALEKAKADYAADARLHREAVREWLGKREEAARAKGDLKAVDGIKAELQAFDEKGEVPKAAPPAIQTRPAASRKALVAAYDAAVKDYVRLKKDDLAAAAVRERDALRATDPAKPAAEAKADWKPLKDALDKVDAGGQKMTLEDVRARFGKDAPGNVLHIPKADPRAHATAAVNALIALRNGVADRTKTDAQRREFLATAHAKLADAKTKTASANAFLDDMRKAVADAQKSTGK